MRIALVTAHSVPALRAPDPATTDIGQLQSFRVTALARTLTGLGHQVTVYARKDSPRRPPAAAAAGFRTEYLAAGPATPLPDHQVLPELGGFSRELAQRWRQRPPDIVHAHFWTSGLAALAAAREMPVPVVQTFGSLGITESQERARSRLEAVIARSVRAVLAGSAREAAALARLGVPRASVTVVPAGVDTGKFGPDGPVARRGKRPRLLAAAPRGTDSGLHVVVRAMTRIPDAELVIVGGPPRAEVTANPVLRDLAGHAQRLGLQDRLLFTGAVSAARMPALLRSADLFVHVASDEPAGHLLLEVMACGTPVVAAAGPVDQDAVIDGTTGALVRSGDPAALTHRIRQLLASPMLLQGYGIAAANRVRTRYSWERVGIQTVAVYEHSRSLAG